jgi:flagellar biosynthesis/type III secretory pathway protein FliH
LVTLRQDPARLRLIGGFVDTYLRLTAAEELRFQRETASVLKRTEQQGVIELMTSWEEKGLARGRAEGLALGRNEGIVLGRNEGLALGRDQGVREVVRRLLQRRWGALSPSVERRLRELACEQVQELADRLLDSRSLAELKK